MELTFFSGVWSGVRLIDVLKAAGVTDLNNFPMGYHIRFASEYEKGGDKLPGGVYGTSITLEKAVRLFLKNNICSTDGWLFDN